jgi:alpha-tubulin suppressor-like RCC1 family protein
MGDALTTVSLGTGRTATAIVAGPAHTCALLDTSEVKCWGDNQFGEIGIGVDENRGDNSGEMGDALPTVDLGTGQTVTALAVGSYHSCAVLETGRIKCWGYNDYGQLGLGDTSARGDEPGEMGDALPTVDLGTGRTAVSIAAGDRFTCALLEDEEVKCWGFNGYGQLGLGDTIARGDGLAEMGDGLPAVDLGTGRTAIAISAGYGHACALLDNGRVKCWGSNNFGLLGLGDTGSRGDDPGEMGDVLPAVDLGTE